MSTNKRIMMNIIITMDMTLYDEYYDDSEDRELSYDEYSVLDENEYEQENNDEYNYYDEHDMKLYDEYYDHFEDREISDRGLWASETVGKGCFQN